MHVRRRTAYHFGLFLLVVLPAWPGSAQVDTKKGKGALPTLSRYTPRTANLFVEVDHLPRLGAPLEQRTLRRIFLQLVGSDEASWRDFVTKTIGEDSDRTLSVLFARRFAIAATHWRKLADGIIILDLPDRDALLLVTGPGRFRSARRYGATTVIQAKSGLWIAYRGNVAVLAKARGQGTLFDACVKILNGKSDKSLAGEEGFRKCVLGVPAARDVCAYWRTAESAPGGTATPASLLSGTWPPFREGALTVFVDGRQIELFLHDMSGSQPTKSYRPRVALRQIAMLPHATLAAWSTSVNPQELFDAIQAATAPTRLEQLWKTVSANTDTERFEEEILRNIGPRCVTLVAVDYTTAKLHPQLGFMIESVDAIGVVEALRETVLRLVEALKSEDQENGFELTSTEHMGTPIHALRLPQLAPPMGDTSIASLVAEDLTPSFAAVRGWIIASSSPDHIRQIIDAQAGLEKRLGEVVPISDAKTQLRKSTSTTVIQPSFALGILRYWDNILRERLRQASGQFRLGVTVHRDPAPGQVIVADVHTNGPASACLKSGDRVLACDDVLLSMESAEEHLEMILAQTPPEQDIRLRLLRDLEIVEVTVKGRSTGLVNDPLRAEIPGLVDHIAPLQEIIFNLVIAVYSVEQSADGAYLAKLLLEFERPAPAPAASTDAAPSAP